MVPLSNPAVAAFIGAGVGGLLSFFSTYFFRWRRSRIQKERLLTSLESEIESHGLSPVQEFLTAMQREAIKEFEGYSGNPYEDTKVSESSSVPEKFEYFWQEIHIEGVEENPLEDIEDMEVAVESGTYLSRVRMRLSTDMYDSNIANLSHLEKEKAAEIAEYYRLVKVVRDGAEGAIVEIDNVEEVEWSEIQLLQDAVREMEEAKPEIEPRRSIFARL